MPPTLEMDAVMNSAFAMSAQYDALGVRLDAASAELATTEASLQSLCDWWHTHEADIAEAAEFLRHGSVKILFFHIPLPKFARGLGVLLEGLDAFMGKVC